MIGLENGGIGSSVCTPIESSTPIEELEVEGRRGLAVYATTWARLQRH